MILTVCTGNLHRSPLLESVLRSAGFSDVASAGTHSPGGGAPPLMVQAAREAGHDLSRHVSRQVTRTILGEAALVIAMERGHVAELSVMHPPAFGYTVTLRELRGLIVANPPVRGQKLSMWLTAVLEGRRTADVLTASPDRDTPDPIGGGLAQFRSCVTDICATAEPVVEALKLLSR